MIIFATIWGILSVVLLFGQLAYAFKYPDDNSKWWLLEIIGISVGWPLILLAIIACGVYTVLKEEI
jgi:hypothetical protein